MSVVTSMPMSSPMISRMFGRLALVAAGLAAGEGLQAISAATSTAVPRKDRINAVRLFMIAMDKAAGSAASMKSQGK
jgi:hypothetical protein